MPMNPAAPVSKIFMVGESTTQDRTAHAAPCGPISQNRDPFPARSGGTSAPGPFFFSCAMLAATAAAPHGSTGLLSEVVSLLDDVLQLQGRALQFEANTALMGALPELDSMAVVELLAGMESRWGVAPDADLDASTFATVGSLASYIEARRR
jgi:acyl carrier protein